MSSSLKTSYAAARAWLLFDQNVLAGMILLFFASAFVLYPTPIWTMTFYLGVFPTMLYTLFRGERPDWTQPCFIFACLLVAWSAMTLVWGEDPGKGRVLKYALGSFFTASYIVSLSMALRDCPMLKRRIGDVFIFFGAANVVYSLAHYFLMPTLDDHRLRGWAETYHPILGALVVGVSLIFALERFIREKNMRKLNGVIALLCAAFILLTQSRGPYLATLASTLVLLGAITWRQRLYLLIGTAFCAIGSLAMAFACFSATPASILQKLSERGTSHRLEIWSFTLARIAERPWLGHGPAAYLGMDDFPFPHDLYLCVLFYNGIVGMLLFVALLVCVIYWLVRQWGHNEQVPLLFSLLVGALIGGLTDLSQLTPGPAPLWIVLWLPMCLIFSEMAKKNNSLKK